MGAPDDAGLSILALAREGGGVRAEVRVDPDGPWFSGHFPDAPILPAIAHLDLLCRVHRAAGGSGRLAGVPALRLVRPVRPGDRLLLAIEPGGRFTVRTPAGAAVSSGSAVWAR